MSDVSVAKRVAAIQMVTGASVERNLEQAAELVARAADSGAAFAALPENFALMPSDERENVRRRELPSAGPIQDFLAEQAARYEMWLLGGTVPMQGRSGERYRAASLLYDHRGRQVARYDKIHLFDVDVTGDGHSYRESRTVEPGDELVVAETPIGRIGMTVCYDMRFPEQFGRLLNLGAEVFVVPAAFTAVTGRAHWEVLLRARAIESLSYVVAPAQGGHHENGRDTHGDTMIVDPWGTVLARHGLGPGLVTVELELEHLQQIRREFPAVARRRKDIVQ